MKGASLSSASVILKPMMNGYNMAYSVSECLCRFLGIGFAGTAALTTLLHAVLEDFRMQQAHVTGPQLDH